MNPKIVILILCSLLSASLSEQTTKTSKDNVLQVTRAMFEDSFTEFQKETLHLNPTFAQLFEVVIVRTKGDTFDMQLTPACFVNLVKRGQGLINEECFRMIKMFNNLEIRKQTLKLAYRCFKNTTILPNPGNYDLHTTHIDKVTYERGTWLIFFTPTPSATCALSYLEDFGVSQQVDLTQEQADAILYQFRSKILEPLSKEQYEASFRGLMEHFYLYRHTTFIFLRKDGTKQLVPLRQCLVVMHANGKGLVHSQCAHSLDTLYQTDPTLLSLFLPYRCFLHDSPDEYELKNTAIHGFGKDKGAPGEQFVVVFRLEKYAHCTPVLAEVSDEWAQSGLRDEL